MNKKDNRLFVQYKDNVGYCENNRITSVYSENQYSFSKSKLGMILGNPTNLRSSASTSSKIIAKLNKNEIIEIVSKSNNWYFINFNGQMGFIYKNLIKIKE
ncbi:MAG: SH3 domain-containing protein [Melioribacteraceae bacterium]|nr:SH3 domain-containing protein [Melioribacteraceae bacterium]